MVETLKELTARYEGSEKPEQPGKAVEPEYKSYADYLRGKAVADLPAVPKSEAAAQASTPPSKKSTLPANHQLHTAEGQDFAKFLAKKGSGLGSSRFAPKNTTSSTDKPTPAASATNGEIPKTTPSPIAPPQQPVPVVKLPPPSAPAARQIPAQATPDLSASRWATSTTSAVTATSNLSASTPTSKSQRSTQPASHKRLQGQGWRGDG